MMSSNHTLTNNNKDKPNHNLNNNQISSSNNGSLIHNSYSAAAASFVPIHSAMSGLLTTSSVGGVAPLAVVDNINKMNNNSSMDSYNRKRKMEEEQQQCRFDQYQHGVQIAGSFLSCHTSPSIPTTTTTTSTTTSAAATATAISIPTQALQNQNFGQSQQQPTVVAVDNTTTNASEAKRERTTPIETIIIYADGACRRNPGPGSWGCLIFQGENANALNEEKAITLSGGQAKTTNNRMELEAVTKGLKHIGNNEKKHVVVYTNSKYVQQGITMWIQKWIENSWKTSAKKQVKNYDLWKALDELRHTHQITWQWIKGQSDNKLNGAVDKICNQYLDKMFPETIRKR